MTASVGELAQDSLALFALIPGMTVLSFWLRGLLISQKETTAVNAGMAVNLVITLSVLGVGLFLRWSGLMTTALALSLAAGVELCYLWWYTPATRDKQFVPQPIGTL